MEFGGIVETPGLSRVRKKAIPAPTIRNAMTPARTFIDRLTRDSSAPFESAIDVRRATNSSIGGAEGNGGPSTALTLNRCHEPSRPFSSCTPASPNSIRHPGLQLSEQIGDKDVTVTGLRHDPGSRNHGGTGRLPVVHRDLADVQAAPDQQTDCHGQESRIAQAQRIAVFAVGERSEEPVACRVNLLTPVLPELGAVTEWCLAWSTFHLRSPSSDAIAVEPIMSVKRMMANAGSGCRGDLGMNQLTPQAS